MLFNVNFTYPPGERDAVHKRFLESGGAPPPDDVKMLGRWHHAEGNAGLLIAEAQTASAIAGWLHQWTDLLTFEVSPVMTDDEFAQVIG